MLNMPASGPFTCAPLPAQPTVQRQVSIVRKTYVHIQRQYARRRSSTSSLFMSKQAVTHLWLIAPHTTFHVAFRYVYHSIVLALLVNLQRTQTTVFPPVREQSSLLQRREPAWVLRA